MTRPTHTSAPPSEPVWDVTFTRAANAVRPAVGACMRELARRFHALSLATEQQARQTPRGMSAFLCVVGQRGLLCIVEITLVDGMAVGQGPRATLDVRLLDACGDVVAESLANGLKQGPGLENLTGQLLPAETLSQAATAIYVSALGHFELLQ